ncbi:LysR family transcriptional regulator (plasmid) [Phaeobacter inhibens]|uniref:LysR family transcriptional regulator n=1 Tax=Phaeobacter inhibens TaxID=221822 RepID=UPI0001632865|nr:LysR family transcriptional regulator [Phaeobacter inhibens]AFO93459.1 transcriptional regulator, LysR family [Phaeobacter inhibens DSM 17395]AUQ48159.1 transcriptional regulator, LysR family [Phaeobacter inhibens]AXT24950.1 LysR family transcriptional regulator [Phaeobacter inhibens]
MSIKIDMLRCFTMVATHGSLSDAADVLGRTPSAVSMMLKQFEDHVGSALFETARKSRLTPIGELILAEARREVAHFENTVSVIEGLSRAELGYLRLAVTPSVATTVLPAVIFKFTERHPNVQIDLRDMDSGTIARELDRERADIGIGSFVQVEGMRRTELFSDAFGVVCRKDHPLADNWDQLDWRTMGDHRIIANGLCKQITDPDFAPILARSHLMVPSTASLLGLVRQGVGITVLPRLAVAKLLDEFAFLPLRDVTTRRTVHLMSRSQNLLMPAARAFLRLVTEMKRDGSLNLDPEIQQN